MLLSLMTIVGYFELGRHQ